MIQVYYGDIRELREEEGYLQRLDRTRRARIEAMTSLEAKKRSLAAGVLLEEAFKEADIREREIGYTEYGKPFLIGVTGFYFNLSHSGDYAACVASDQPCGVDVQRVELRDRIAQRCYSPKEQEYMRQSQDQEYAFTKIWTMRESYMKALGKGLSQPMKSYETDPVRMERQGWKWSEWRLRGYILMVCAQEISGELRKIDL